jgi:hypothetical protein
MGITGEFQVIEMRYVTGPEMPWILEPRPPLVQRWYVKAQLVDDPTFRARWLVEKRSPATEGIAAVASFNTAGYQSPDWRGFLGEGEPRAVEGLPGTWGASTSSSSPVRMARSLVCPTRLCAALTALDAQRILRPQAKPFCEYRGHVKHPPPHPHRTTTDIGTQAPPQRARGCESRSAP